MFGITSERLVFSITLATLGLLSFGLLVSRYKMEDIYRKEKTRDTIEFSNCKIESLDKLFENSDEIWMVGIILRNTTTDNFYHFKRKSAAGARFRTMIVDLNEVNLNNIIKRFSRAGKRKHFLNDMDHVVNQYISIFSESPNPENIQLRMIDFVPSFSMYIFPNKNNNGIAIIESYCYQSTNGSIPKYKITERDNPEWYKHFVEQFVLMWNDSAKINLDEE